MWTSSAATLLVGLLASAPLVAHAGHSDMFSCRGGKTCLVTELGDGNFDSALAEAPHFVMFYAPWCGHCKQLAPTLKRAAKTLEAAGVKVGAVDVEPNPTVQGKFPDIKGFPTLKFLPSSNPKKAVDFNGGRDEESIVAFAKEQAKKFGVAMGEPVDSKTAAELYTFFGRAALGGKPALLVVGAPNTEPPPWAGKLAAELRKAVADPRAPSPEAQTKELLREAARTTNLAAVKDAVAELLVTMAAAEKSPPLGPAVVSPAFTADPAAAAAFGLSPADLPALLVASVDRKTGGGSYVKHVGPVADAAKKGKKSKGSGPDLAPLVAFVRGLLPAALQGPGAFAQAPQALALPEFAKPAAVLAAEDREQKRKAREGGIAQVDSAASLQAHCYNLATKTCALLAVTGGADHASDALKAVAAQFGKEGFSFAAVDPATAPPNVVAALFGGVADSGAWPAVALVKGGKRPRAAVASGSEDAIAALLASAKSGEAKFEKVSGGSLPVWPDSSGDADSGGGDDAAGGGTSEGEL